jgi:CDP-paratose 2-epimerase
MPSILITGGAGFIGVNSAVFFANNGWDVFIVDNLSRKGTESNIAWLRENLEFTFYQNDIRDYEAISKIINQTKPDMLLHLAAQVAVTTSYYNPREDFEINALGSFNILEAIRHNSPETFVLYASTNKVYGGMEDVPVILKSNGYQYANLGSGVNETHPLDFHSPYGCSKGVADQYTIDYARIYDLKTCSFRQSCIYGIRQFGIEDQGWVAWFTIAAILNKPITLFGDGWQTRDVLNVSDLVRAYKSAWDHQETVSGQAFNIGGGINNTLCLRDLLSLLEQKLNINISPRFDESRPGDQPVFICDIGKAQRLLEWTPTININDGLDLLASWVEENIDLFS